VTAHERLNLLEQSSPYTVKHECESVMTDEHISTCFDILQLFAQAFKYTHTWSKWFHSLVWPCM